MKVLLITDQYVDVRIDGCYCNYALLSTLKNINEIGELYIAAACPSSGKPAAQPIDQKIGFIGKEQVKHLKPLTSSVLDYLINRKYNQRLLSEMIPSVDLIIGYTPGHNINTAFKIAKRCKIPYMTFLVACPWDAMSNHKRLIVRIMAPIYYFQTRIITKESDYVHYVTRSFLQKRYPTKGKSLGCSDANFGDIDISFLKKRLDKIDSISTADEVKITTIGHLDARHKGHEYVIKAIARLCDNGENKYHYYIIGAGEGLSLKRLSEHLNVVANVHFLGRQSVDQVMNLLADSDIYIQPSLQEGLPRAVVEAMSVALPCIGFNTGGIPELLDDALVVCKKDINGIIRCIKHLDDKEYYRRVAIRNFNVAKEYEHTTLSSKILLFFRSVRKEITDML